MRSLILIYCCALVFNNCIKNSYFTPNTYYDFSSVNINLKVLVVLLFFF